MRFFIVLFFCLITSFSWSNVDERIAFIKKYFKPSVALDKLNVLKNIDFKNDKIAAFTINNAIADSYTDLGMYHASIAFLKQNLEGIQKLNFKDYSVVADMHLNLAHNYEQVFMFSQYLLHVEKYYKAIQQENPKKQIYKAVYFAYLSKYYNIKYEIDKAKYYSSNALKIYHQYKKDSNLIKVHNLYAAHLFSLRNVDEKTYVNKFKYLDTLNYFLDKEIPQNSTKKAKILVSSAAYDFDISINAFNGEFDGNPKFHMKRAISVYDKALKMHEDLVSSNHNISARIHSFKLLLYLAADDYSKAIKECDKGIEKLSDLELLPYGFSSNNYFMISLLKAKNRILIKMNTNNNVDIQKQIIQNLEQLEIIWNRYFEDQIKEASDYMSNMYNESPYSLLFDSYLKLYQITNDPNYLKKIHEYDEKSKYSALLNTVFLSPIEKKEKEVLSKKRQAIYELYDSYIFFKNNTKSGNASTYSNLKQEIIDYDSIEKNTKLFENFDITSLKKTQNQLSNSDAIISFFRTQYGERTLYAKVVLRDNIYLVELIKDKKSSENIVKDLQLAVLRSLQEQNIDNFKKNSNMLFKIIFEKIEKILPKEITHLELIPNSELSNFPFEMLLFDNTVSKDWRKLPYLLNKYHFNQVLSSSITNLNSKPTHNKNKLVFFLPSFKEKKLQELYISKITADEFAKKYEAQLLCDDLASKTSFIEHLKSSNIISVFSHGQSFLDFDDSKKGIYFSDGFLTLKEIYTLKSNCDFLILEACETGLGGKDNGEGNINLSRAFTSIGVKSMLLASWKIDEGSSLEITTSFFSYLEQGFTKSEALQKAKLDYIKNANPRSSSPFYWAGLQLLGSNENVVLKDNTNYLKYWYLLFVPIIVLGFYFRKRK